MGSHPILLEAKKLFYSQYKTYVEKPQPCKLFRLSERSERNGAVLPKRNSGRSFHHKPCKAFVCV